MKAEGIIIQKTPYKEKDLICHMLLRSGKTLPVYFYGGRGGGKQSKGSILELGFMINIHLREQRKSIGDAIHIAKEYQLGWNSKNIRNDYQAMCLMSFYLELIAKIATAEDIQTMHGEEHSGLFKVLSNALFYLDDSMEKKSFQIETQLFLFLTKLIVDLGITPDVHHCLFCDKELKLNELCLFSHVDGGFSCSDCSSKVDEFLSENKQAFQEHKSAGELRLLLSSVYKMNFKDYATLKLQSPNPCIAALTYLNFQFGFKLENFKTWKNLV